MREDAPVRDGFSRRDGPDQRRKRGSATPTMSMIGFGSLRGRWCAASTC